jgi:hypothetical protein
MSEEQGTHFWFMTMQVPNALGLYVNSYQGTWSPSLGATRFELFNEIRDYVERNDPKIAGGMVLAFDIQPNQL